MNLAFLAFLVSVTVSLLSFTLIASWYVIPRLSKQPYLQALLPLILLNVFRTEGLVFLLPQVIGGTLPSGFAIPAAYGDLVTAVLALLTALVLRLRPGLALPLVWLVNIVGFADLLFATYKGVAVGFPSFHVGVAWFIPTMYVPLLLVNHVVVFWFLLRVVPSAVNIAPAPLNTLANVQKGVPNRQ
ncbi:hypothetical protein KDH_10260 [Dictyobacter sp. S3.2.2.5]|uniref:Rod shape-determining protein MreD n=1 Tax=Dictyobacter halimunensis TaxID=3026934 RepID=A0ABQ6FMC8_9CHLR|nr:hypothetical protein KDH_10260 [Dictyobacter sp. S3.2.2.5]